MRVSLALVLLAGCSSEPEATTADNDAAVDGAVDSIVMDTTAAADTASDSVVDDTFSSDASDAPAVSTCLELMDGTGATPTSGTDKVAWAKTYTPNGWITGGAASGAQVYVTGLQEQATPKLDTLDLVPKSTVGRTGFIAKLASDGTPAWARGIAGTTATGAPRGLLALVGSDVAYAFGSDSAYTVHDKSGAAGTIAFGVLRSDGSTRSFTTFPIATGGSVRGLAADAAGGVHLIASFGKSTDIGGKTLDCDFVLVTLDADAKVKSSRCLDVLKGSLFSIDGFAVDAAGNAYVSAYPRAEVDVGDGKKTVMVGMGGSILFKIDPADKTVWSQVWFGAYARGLAVTADGTIYTHGDVPWPKDVTIANTLLKKCDVGSARAITKLDTSGKRLWTKLLTHTTLDDIVLADDGVWFRTQPMGPGELAKGVAAPTDLAIGKVSSAGALKLVQTFRNEADPTRTPVGFILVGNTGPLVAVGQLFADVKLGTTTLKPKGSGPAPMSDLAFAIGP